jgi:hypothetical protein
MISNIIDKEGQRFVKLANENYQYINVYHGMTKPQYFLSTKAQIRHDVIILQGRLVDVRVS